jgi:membrane peptidoglycan carboxypeptidase
VGVSLFPRADQRTVAQHPTTSTGAAGAAGAAVAHRRVWLRRLLIGGLGALAALVVAVVLLFALTPSVADAQARVREFAARDGATHLNAPVPRLFAESIVASEDARFYAEPGIDPIGIVRAGWTTLTHSGTDAGGSTLSQQLVKMLYTGGHSGLADDIEQVALAVKLNLHYSKTQILQMYAATVYFGHGFYGLHDAACGYFGVPPSGLTLTQASVLAGLVQAPSAYDPLRHPALARSRQQYVLDRLLATGKISPAQARAAATAPLDLAGRTGSARICG